MRMHRQLEVFGICDLLQTYVARHGSGLPRAEKQSGNIPSMQMGCGGQTGWPNPILNSKTFLDNAGIW